MTENLEYNKLILSKVSFCKEIFEKELFKALKSVVPSKRLALIKYCTATYSMHYKIIRKFLPRTIRKKLYKRN